MISDFSELLMIYNGLSLLILLKYADKFYNSYNSMYLDEHLDATDIFESI